MNRLSQHRIAAEPARENLTVNPALAIIREQFLRLDADEQRALQRILRQAERLDAALADLHLFLPVVEICFYGLGSNRRRFSIPRLRRLIKRWDAEGRNSSKPFRCAIISKRDISP